MDSSTGIRHLVLMELVHTFICLDLIPGHDMIKQSLEVRLKFLLVLGNKRPCKIVLRKTTNNLVSGSSF